MQETSKDTIIHHLAAQRALFATQQTKSIDFRLAQLRKLKRVILDNQQNIEAALWEDLHKSPEEAYLSEISIVIGEIDYQLKHLKKWASPKRVRTPLHLLPSSSKIITEPLGVALIIAPWNYPFQLLINSLIGAMSAGCCSMVKPSPDASSVAKLMQDIIEATFDANYIAIVQGGRETNTRLLEQRFDCIFFTGSPTVGKVVMQAAAKHLIPVVLELGGKSPCIVDADADLTLAAKRIVWGKLINAGQTCIAPDYLFVHESVKAELLENIVKSIKAMYGEDIKTSRFYPRIINERAMERLEKLIAEGDIYTGGEVDKTEKFIAPTILDNVQPNAQILKEEIFGPILPVLTFTDIDDALTYINHNEKPLAFYYFGSNDSAQDVLGRTTSGGACINDTLIHIVNHHLPFGGVGNSGIGKYHGKASFDAFSNQRAVVSSPTWIDLPFKYVPFKWFKWVKRVL